MEKQRRGTSLSSKMILTTTGLILGVVALFGFFDATRMQKLFDEQSSLLQKNSMDNLRRRGDVQTRDLVQAGRTAVLNSDYTTLQNFIPQVASKDDREVAYAFVADSDGKILAHSDAAQNGRDPDAAGKDLISTPQSQGKQFDSPGSKLLGFSRPIEHEGRRVGTVVIAFNLAPIDEQVKAIADEKALASQKSTLRTILLGLMFVLFGSAIAVFQGLRISRPITLLAWRADQIARGDLATRVDISSNDEIGRLGESFNFMADQLVILLRETAEKAVLEKELEVARAIQETLVPTADVFERRGVKVCGYFMPSSQCGGDWWTVHDLAPGKVLVVIGDVTGHGTPAAMITACAKSACDTIRGVTGEKLTVSYLLHVLNGAIYESARRRFVMTCFAAIIDSDNKTITFANAGHQFPYLFRPRGEKSDPANSGAVSGAGAGESAELRVLTSRGNPLGDVQDSTYTEKTESIEAGDSLVWYTDGIVECENNRGEEFGEKRFRAAIRAAAGLDPQAMRDNVLKVAADFFGEQPRKDDITMVFAKVSA